MLQRRGFARSPPLLFTGDARAQQDALYVYWEKKREKVDSLRLNASEILHQIKDLKTQQERNSKVEPPPPMGQWSILQNTGTKFLRNIQINEQRGEDKQQLKANLKESDPTCELIITGIPYTPKEDTKQIIEVFHQKNKWNRLQDDETLCPRSSSVKSEMSKPAIVRLLTIGDSGAGKSSLLLRYTQNEFTVEYMPTIGIDFRLKTIEIKGKTVKVQVWDTAGQERFRTITHNYYRGAHGIALVYDVTHEGSFQNIRKWIQDVRTYAEDSVNIVLIGNKCDLESKIAVDKARGKELAEEYNIPFFETSAKANIEVQEAFTCLVNAVCERLFSDNATANGGNTATVTLNERGDKGKKACCG
eukprot:g5608.t1